MIGFAKSSCFSKPFFGRNLSIDERDRHISPLTVGLGIDLGRRFELDLAFGESFRYRVRDWIGDPRVKKLLIGQSLQPPFFALLGWKPIRGGRALDRRVLVREKEQRNQQNHMRCLPNTWVQASAYRLGKSFNLGVDMPDAYNLFRRAVLHEVAQRALQLGIELRFEFALGMPLPDLEYSVARPKLHARH